MTGRLSRRSFLGTLVATAGCASRNSQGTATTSPIGTQTTVTTKTSTPTPEPVDTREWTEAYYRGPLVSAHEHMNGPGGFRMTRDKLSWYVRWMERNRVNRVMAITQPRLLPRVGEFDNSFVPFAFPHSFLDGDRSDLATRLRQVIDRFDDVQGLGEFALYRFRADGKPVPLPPDAPELLKVYDLAAELDLPVMVHAAEPWRFPKTMAESWNTWLDCPTLDQMATAYAHNRDTTFLVHGTYFGHEVQMTKGEMVADVLDRHPNLYYDISPIAPFAYSAGKSGHGKMSQEPFEKKMADTGVEHHVEQYYQKFRPLLESYSDRVLWGMDASLSWHYHRWVLDAWIDVARSLLGRLPPENARNVGYRTAEQLFGITIQSTT